MDRESRENFKKHYSLNTGISIHSGFPNPASDQRLHTLNFNDILIQNTASTFTFRIKGQDWNALGIFDADLAVVDRALDPGRNDIVVWWHDGSFGISFVRDTPRDAQHWGVVTAVIHQFRKAQK